MNAGKTEEKPRVLCVDDEPNVLEGLRLHLERSWRLSTAVGSGWPPGRLWPCRVTWAVLPGSIMGGWFADHIGVRATMMISALGYMAFTIVLAFSRTVRAERR